MCDKNFLIKNLEDLKNIENFSNKVCVEILMKYKNLSKFYKSHVRKFLKYVKIFPEAIKKYAQDYNEMSNIKYTQEENQIIQDIKDHCLDIFWLYDMESKNYNPENVENYEIGLVLNTAGKEKELRERFINYIIQFAFCEDNTKLNLVKSKSFILKYFDETDTYTLDSKDFKLTPMESYTLKEILKPFTDQRRISGVNVYRINKKAEPIIFQKLIEKKTNKPYRLSSNIKCKF